MGHVLIGSSPPMPSDRHCCAARITRRAALRGVAGLLTGAIAGTLSAQARTPEIVQPRTAGREAYMERADAMRRRAIERALRHDEICGR